MTPDREWVEVWDKFEPLLRQAIEYDLHDFTIEDVREGVEAGMLQFWHSADAAVVTDVVELQSGKPGVQVIVGGGSYDGVMDVIEKIEAWAREKGMEALITVGRVGWNRTERARSWRHVASVFVKYLKEH